MGVKTVTVKVGERVPTLPDRLPSDCLTLDVPNHLSLEPGVPIQVNLTVNNSSPVGRMAHIHVTYDASQGVFVQIPDPKVYVAPEGKTVTYALIESKIGSKGQCNINFGVH